MQDQLRSALIDLKELFSELRRAVGLRCSQTGLDQSPPPPFQSLPMARHIAKELHDCVKLLLQPGGIESLARRIHAVIVATNRFVEKNEYRRTGAYASLGREQIREALELAEAELRVFDSANKEPGPVVASTFDAPATAYLSVNDIAQKFGVESQALRKRLDRWRSKNLEGWIENTDMKSREPKYLYKVKSVMSVVKELQAKSIERPSKKT